jgi:hypothetical protein
MIWQKDTTTMLIMTLHIKTILLTLKMGDITYNDTTYKLLFLEQ